MTCFPARVAELPPGRVAAAEWRSRLSRASREFTLAVAEGRLRDAASFRLAVAVIEQLLDEEPALSTAGR